MLTGLLITLDGHLEAVTLDNTTTSTLVRELHRTLGCDTFDLVPLAGGITLYVDDEGLYRSTLNPILTLTAARLGAATALFGRGIFLGYDPDTGETLSLARHQARAVVNACLTAIVRVVSDTLDTE